MIEEKRIPKANEVIFIAADVANERHQGIRRGVFVSAPSEITANPSATKANSKYVQ